MKKKRIVIQSTLNCWTYQNHKVLSKTSNVRLTKQWIEGRINIFMNYTLKCLKAQTNQEFIANIMYEDCTEDIVQKALGKYNTLPDNIQFCKKSDNKSIIKKAIDDYEYLYLVRLDSDDMYHKSYIQQLYDYNHKDSTQVLINQNGFIYDSMNNKIVKCHCESPTFYTLIYNTKDYLSGIRYKLIGGHPGAIKLSHEIISNYNYIWHVHSSNVLSNFMNLKMHMRGKVITDYSEINKILVGFIR